MTVLSGILASTTGRPSSRTIFQLAAVIGLNGKSPEETMNRCIRLTMQWLQDMFHGSFPRDAWSGVNFAVDEPGRKAECIAVPELNLWTVRVELSEATSVSQEQGKEGTRTTDISFARRDAGVAFGIRVQGGAANASEEGMRLARPRVVADISHQFTLKECRAISDEPWLVETEEELDILYDLLMNPRRTLPVVDLTQPDKRKWTVPVSDYVLDPQLTAEQMMGLAYIVQFPWEIGFRWSDKVGKIWSAYLGSVRLYMPEIDFAKDNPLDHPLYLTDKILFWRHDGLTAERAFISYLTDKLAAYSSIKRVNWEDRLFLTDARAKAAEIARAKLAPKPVTTDDLKQQVAALREELKLTTEAHAKEIEALHRKIEEISSEAEEFNDDAIRVGRERDFLREENELLRNRVRAVRAELFVFLGFENDRNVDIPDSYDEMPEWVASNLEGRLMLHPRAAQGLKAACYDNITQVYEVLLVLANHYRNMKLGTGTREDFSTAIERMQLRCSKSITEIRAGEQGDTYYVKFPVGSSNSRFLEMHLRSGGNSRDPHRCLAVYFFWDEESRQVVVGWLPSHLENRFS